MALDDVAIDQARVAGCQAVFQSGVELALGSDDCGTQPQLSAASLEMPRVQDELILHLYAALAEKEPRQISGRTRSALASRKLHPLPAVAACGCL